MSTNISKSKDQKFINPEDVKLLADMNGILFYQFNFNNNENENLAFLSKVIVEMKKNTGLERNNQIQIPVLEAAILGDVFVGKTSLINRLIHQTFLNKYTSTNIIEKHDVVLNVDERKIILKIRELSGLSIMKTSFLNENVSKIRSFILIYDVTSLSSFEKIKFIQNQISLKEKKFVVILVGNKNEENLMNPRQVTFVEGLNFSKKINCSFIETSVKENSVENIFIELIRETRLKFNDDNLSTSTILIIIDLY